MTDPPSLLEEARRQLINEEGDLRRRTALVTGSVALGAVITGTLFRRLRHLQLKAPDDLAPALDADCEFMEIMEGRACFYKRDGTGVPLVLLHSINAAASSFEMKPVFDYFARETARPIYALDWIGFGRSDRPPVRYTSSLYIRQLRRFLSEHVHQPADVVALSIGAEYTAEIATALPYLVQRLVFISPTGLSASEAHSAMRRAVVSLSDSVGAFEIFFHRLTRPEMLRRFYERQIFRSLAVPEELVEYARATTLVKGAHHAPRYFVQGELTSGEKVTSTYLNLRVPTLIVAPENDADLVQQFDGLEELLQGNAHYIQAFRLPAGLMPHWKAPHHLFEEMNRFLTS